jgi:hypothetical protein
VNAARWDSTNGSVLVNGGGTHMALLRGTADVSFVLHWHDGIGARLWQTNPGDTVGLGIPVGYEAFNTL